MRAKTYIARYFFYLMGLLILAAGITLNTKTGLGVSPLVSVPYCVAEIWGLNFGNTTFVFYAVLVAAQFIIKGKNRRAYDALQLIVSLVFTRVLNLFSVWMDFPSDTWLQKGVLLFFAVVCTGVGGAMSVRARLVANPGDAIVHALSGRSGRSMGFCKNCFDAFCVAISLLLGLICTHSIVGIGLGTVVTVLLVGRVMWLYDCWCAPGIARLSGLAAPEAAGK